MVGRAASRVRRGIVGGIGGTEKDRLLDLGFGGNVSGGRQLTAGRSAHPLDRYYRVCIGVFVVDADVRVAREFSHIGIVVDANHVGYILQVVGAPSDRIHDSLLRGRLSIGAHGVRAATRYEVNGQGSASRNEDQQRHRYPLGEARVHQRRNRPDRARG